MNTHTKTTVQVELNCQFLQLKSTKSLYLRARTEKDIVCDQSFGELAAIGGEQDVIITLDQSTVQQLSGHDYKHLQFRTILPEVFAIFFFYKNV